jgi:hypothetical protein
VLPPKIGDGVFGFNLGGSQVTVSLFELTPVSINDLHKLRKWFFKV